MTRILASGADSAMALARSRTMEALVLNRSIVVSGMMAAISVHLTVAGHSRLPRYTCWDEDDFRALQTCVQLFLIVLITSDNALGVDMAYVSGNTCCTFDVIDG